MGGKKKGQSGLGKAVIRDRFKATPHKGSSFLHTSELQDGYDWGRLNLQSVTEQSNLDDFLATAQLAGTEFTAEKLNIRFVNPAEASRPSPEDVRRQREAEESNRNLLRVPRRPRWDITTSPEELDRKEKESFLDWRRQLAELGEQEHIILTPFEKNLEFWRQLWRVIERSDVVVQIVDGRNPLLYRCEDLEKYVKELDENKQNVILVNKADYLTDKQRKYWYDYFVSQNIDVVFWSAVLETERLKQQEAGNQDSDDDSCEASDEDSESDNERTLSEITENTETVESTDHRHTVNSELDSRNDPEIQPEVPEVQSAGSSSEAEIAERLGQTGLVTDEVDLDKWRILNGDELTEMWKRLHQGVKVTEGVTTVGLVGYPNVGKSSTINALLNTKKVPVSATPGRTKHFQTLYLDTDLLLCDCPGLVMPSFVSTKAGMVVSGILPIDQMRDYAPPVQLVCDLMGRSLLEATYGMNLPAPMEGEDPDRPPTAHELLTAYGYMRGFMTQKGLPDLPRSSRIILKDFVNGKLLYRYPPPGVATDEFEPTTFPAVKRTNKSKHEVDTDVKEKTVPVSSIDKAFFQKVHKEVHSKGTRAPSVASGGSESAESLNVKPWKKHHNKGKKEKLRRTFAHLDEH